MDKRHLAVTRGFHFCALVNGAPILRDGRPLVIGKTYTHEGEVALCASGYHDSLRVLDALWYAPGPYLCRTRMGGTIQVGPDKRVASERTAVAGVDCTTVLREYALRVALVALLAERERGREPDPRSWAALGVLRRWIDGDASDGELGDAADASYAAAADADASYAATAAATRYADADADAAADAASWLDSYLLSMLPPALR
jgi:hypothetical protein